jgi:hypothetical protein
MTTISNMMAIITAKLAKMRWRNVQFFTVSPRGAVEMLRSIAEGCVSFIRLLPGVNRRKRVVK